MKAFKVNATAVAATFSREELELFGFTGGSVTRDLARTLADAAFSELGERPKKITVKAYVSDAALLLFAEENPDVFRLWN